MPQNATDNSFPHCSSKGFRTVLEIDTLGTFNMCNAAFPRLKEANGATIVSVTATLHYGNTDKTEMRKNTGSFSCLIWGIVIIFSSFFPSFFFFSGATWYQAHASAAKAAIDSLTRSLGLEWGEFGIRVCGVAPGPIADTPGTEQTTTT
jgi:peroxisomal 2,4-dienoyl-CoA reductase